MGKIEKLLEKILLGGADANIEFNELVAVLHDLGFTERSKGSHHIFIKPGVEDLINLQRDGNKAKPYQVRQVKMIIQRYSLWSRS